MPKTREAVNSKEHLVEALIANLSKSANMQVSKAKAWTIAGTVFSTAFSLATDKALSLAGIGRFHVLTSKRSVAASKPALRMRFRASSKVNEILNGDKNFVKIAEAAPEAPAPAAKQEAKAEKPSNKGVGDDLV